MNEPYIHNFMSANHVESETAPALIEPMEAHLSVSRTLELLAADMGGHLVSDSNVLTELAIEGLGVALCGLELIQRPIKNGDLIIPFPEMKMRHPMGYYLLTRKSDRLSDVAQQFVTWLKEEARQTEGAGNPSEDGLIQSSKSCMDSFFEREASSSSQSKKAWE